MLDQAHVSAASAEEGSRADLEALAYKLDALSTWLFMAAGLVLVCTLIGAILVLTTTINTLGLVSPQAESRSRFAIAAVMFGSGIAGAGVVAGLGGILKALVRRREL
jgi:hypothetical protein